jgi:hypothetical protein
VPQWPAVTLKPIEVSPSWVRLLNGDSEISSTYKWH